MNDILEILLGSKTRVRLMRALLLNPEKEYLLEEMAEKNKLRKPEVRKELTTLTKIKFVMSKIKKKQKYYRIDREFPLYDEIEKLFLKTKVSPQCKGLRKIRVVGNVKLVLLSGVFLNYPKSRVDLLVVADNVVKSKLKSVIANLEAEIGKEIRYMVLTSDELSYRLDMLDRFLLDFFKAPHDVVINKIPKFKNIVSNVSK